MPLFSPPAPTPNLSTIIAASGASQNLSAAGQLDPVFDVTLTAACTLSLAALATGRLQTITCILRQDATAGRVATLPLCAWPNGSVPVLNTKAGYYDILQFSTVDGGATWFGSVIAAGVQVLTAPGAPTLTVTPGNGQNTISFADGATGGDPISSHQLARSTTAGGEGTPVPVSLTNGAYIDMGLTNGQAYYYKGYAGNRVALSVASGEVTATPVNYTGPAHYLNLAQANGQVYANGTAANDATDSYLDMSVWAALNTYVAAVNTLSLVQRYTPGGTSANSSWQLLIDTTGQLRVYYYDQGGTYRGPAGPGVTVASANPDSSNGIWMRAVINLKSTSVTSAVIVGGSTVGGVNSGGTAYVAAPSTVAYFVSTDGITWTQQGSTVTGVVGTGFKSLGTSGAAVTVGSFDATTTRNSTPLGKFFKATVRDSTKILANPDMTAQPTTAQGGTFVDTAATVNTWNVYNATIV